MAVLIWAVMRGRRAKGEASMDVTDRATRSEYADEEQRRREGTDDR